MEREELELSEEEVAEMLDELEEMVVPLLGGAEDGLGLDCIVAVVEEWLADADLEPTWLEGRIETGIKDKLALDAIKKALEQLAKA
jgi:hypothetical protein